MTRTLIVDDSDLARRGIREVLGGSPEFEIAGEAGNAATAVAKVRELRPDLVLMDLRMPGPCGLEAIRAIKEEFPSIVVVVLSVSDDPQDFFEAIRCGAQGYLIKNVEPELWLEYLEALVHGDARISRAIASRILREFAHSAPASAALPNLTPREEEILTLVARGLLNKEIGDTLGIVEGTVKRHLQNILAKLHLRNRVELATFAVRHRLAKPPDGGA
ncbi:MAG TPA: response regulator transcription factor [bacterium]|nr:response regulator transcription factor [bacterium]